MTPAIDRDAAGAAVGPKLGASAHAAFTDGRESPIRLGSREPSAIYFSAPLALGRGNSFQLTIHRRARKTHRAYQSRR